jgi:hypothetical protein
VSGTFDGLCSDLYNCAHRGSVEATRARVGAPGSLRRRTACGEARAPRVNFALVEGRRELPSRSLTSTFATPRKRTCLLLAARAGDGRLLSPADCQVRRAASTSPGHGAMTSLHWAARQGSARRVCASWSHCGGDVWAAHASDGFHADSLGGDERPRREPRHAARRRRQNQGRPPCACSTRATTKHRTPAMYAALNGHRTALAIAARPRRRHCQPSTSTASRRSTSSPRTAPSRSSQIILDKLPRTVAARRRRSSAMPPAPRRSRRSTSPSCAATATLCRTCSSRSRCSCCDVVQHARHVASAERANWSASQWTSFTGVLRHLSRPEAGLSSLLLDAVVAMLDRERPRAPQLARRQAGGRRRAHAGRLSHAHRQLHCTIFKAGDPQITADAADSLQALWNELDGAASDCTRASRTRTLIDTTEHVQQSRRRRHGRAQPSRAAAPVDDDDDGDDVASRPKPTSEQIAVQVRFKSAASTAAKAARRLDARNRRRDDDDDGDDDADDQATTSTTSGADVAAVSGTTAPATTAVVDATSAAPECRGAR